MANQQVQDILNKYGGNFGGNGVSTAPTIATIRSGVQFDPNTNQHYTTGQDGQAKAVAPASAPSGGFVQKLAAVGSETVHMGTQAVEAGAKFVANTPKYIYQGVEPFLKPLAEVITNSGGHDIQNIKTQQAQIDKNVQTYTDLYKSGKVSKDQYATYMRDASKSYQELSAKAQQVTDYAHKQGDPQSVAVAAANTAATILSAGRFRPVAAVGAKAAGEGFVMLNSASKVGLASKLDQAGSAVEAALQKIPAFRELVTRNLSAFTTESAKQLSGETTSQFIGRNTKDLAIGMLIKRPIVYQTNIGLAQDTYKDILSGNYDQAVKDAAWIGAQAIGGGPVGWFMRNSKEFAGKIRKLAVGKGSFIDEISKRIGDGSPSQVALHLQDLKASNPEEFAKAEKTLRIAQEVNLQTAGEDAARAADAITSHYEQHAVDLSTLTPQKLVEDLDKWAQADEIARGLSPAGGAGYVAVRWDSVAKNALADKIAAAGNDYNAMAKIISDMSSQPGVGWGNNNILMGKIVNAVRNSGSSEEAAQAIREISTVANVSKDIPAGLAKKLADLGYTLAEPFGGRKTPSVDFADTRRLVSEVASGASDIFDETVAPHPDLSAIADTLRRYGVSPESNTNVAYDKLSQAMVTNLQNLNVHNELGLVGDDPAKGAKFILSRLQTFIDGQKPNPYLNIGTFGRGNQSALQDVRQMNINEIMDALPGITKQSAKELQKAIIKSYADVPLEFRGLGIKAFDYAYKVPGAKTYFRIQSALRYTYNPFFRAQEVIETKTLSHMKANNLVWMKPHAELDRVATLLDDSKIFSSGYTGEATQDLTIGRVHANLLKVQKRDLSGLALDIAEKKGLTVEQMIQDHPDELADALRVIVQYPTKGVLNSSLARTLNIAFFPMRYNLKVAGMVAEEVAKLPPTIQTAFIHSTFKANEWMKSPEGIQWQSDNNDAIQLFSYFLPTQNVASVYHLLTGGPDSIGEMGQLGGLPFGFISQILDTEGIIHLNTPYVNPKTGSVVPDYIPATTKAKAAVALQGFLNSMFTYPGAIIGMPAKGKFLRDQVSTVLRTDRNKEYLQNVRTQDLTPLQQKWIDVLTNPNITDDQINQLYVSPAPGEFNWYTLPPMNLPQPVKVLSRTEVAQMKAGQSNAPSSKKKALPIPDQGQSLQL